MTPGSSPSLALLLAPLAALYGAAVRARNRRYDRPGAAFRASIPVVSVGNLAVGGTGKTPLVAWIARRLFAEGRRPAVVTRGYGGRAGKGPLLLSLGRGPTASWDVAGDEPVLLARLLPGALVVVGSDRVAGAEAAARSGADVAVLDDGFQHRRLARDVDLVLLDAAAPLGNGKLLPSGILREPPSSLRRAAAVVATRLGDDESASRVEEVVSRHAPGIPVIRAGHHRAGFVDASGEPAPKPERAVAFCGIARPDRFLADLEREGVAVPAARAFPDHHPYTLRELRGLLRIAAKQGASLVTTEKDLARLPEDAARAEGIAALRIEARVHDEEALLALLRRGLAR